MFTDKNNFFNMLEALADLTCGSLKENDILNGALELMAAHLGVMRSAVSTLNPADGKIRISAAYGLQPEQMARGEYNQGEGITGNVVARGEAVYVRDIAREPRFLNRTRSRDPHGRKITFICVPIIWAKEVVGSLWMDHYTERQDRPEEWLGVLKIVAAMLAPVIHAHAAPHWNECGHERNFGGFVGDSSAMRDVYAQIMQVAPSRLTVFLRGESGTGKELAARAIHDGSPRATGPFISVNCAALPENLIESELFGHERGAFTGAISLRKGKFELADHGTLFLDEIGEMSPCVQAKLLRVLQEHAFERVGGAQLLHVDARVIAATNRNLEQMVEDGTFRQDLYYRLNVFPMRMPSLRERIEDIPALAAYFLRSEAQAARREAPGISMAAMTLLKRYAWPGNIRELRNVMERAFVLLDKSPVVLPVHLPENINNESLGAFSQEQQVGDLKDQLAHHEKTAIISALEESRGHIGKAARALGLTERIFSLRLARYGICYKDFRRKSEKGANGVA